jgi:peptidoglycan-associated lipoprotein
LPKELPASPLELLTYETYFEFRISNFELPTMTSLSRILLALLLATVLAACGGKKTSDQSAGQLGDSDNVTGTPLPSRDEGVSFLSSNVSKSQFGPVYFAFDSFAVGSGELPKIKAVADFLSQAQNSLIIAGFTDARGTPEYNRALGEKRAGAVREQLIRMGVNPGRIQTVSFGMEMPVDSGSSDAAYAKNRRAEFGVTK